MKISKIKPIPKYILAKIKKFFFIATSLYKLLIFKHLTLQHLHIITFYDRLTNYSFFFPKYKKSKHTIHMFGLSFINKLSIMTNQFQYTPGNGRFRAHPNESVNLAIQEPIFQIEGNNQFANQYCALSP